MVLLLVLAHGITSTMPRNHEGSLPSGARPVANASLHEIAAASKPKLALLLPLWSPLTQWERANGPQYRELWRHLPTVPGVYATSLINRNSSTKALGNCKALASTPTDATAVIWSGIAVALRHFFDHAGCVELLAAVENRSTIVAFEPLYSSNANCPRLHEPQTRAKYLTVPYPSQFHARSDQAVKDHLAAIINVRRRHLLAYFGGLHGRQVELRNQLRNACREAGPRCADLAVCGDPRHQGSGVMDIRCEAAEIDEKDTGTFGRILNAYFHSDFCLMPGGDTPTRQGIMDALLVGCIPVFFATCVHGALYEVAYHPFIPRYNRKAWGPGDWSVLLNSSRVLHDISALTADLEAINHETRRAMRARIAKFLPQLQYSAPGVRLREFADAQQVYEQVVPRPQESQTSISNTADTVRRPPPNPPPSRMLPNQLDANARQAECEAEKSFELARDGEFGKLTSLPRPFPLDDEFPIVLETPEQCAGLLKGLSGPSPRVLVAIETYKQIGMVRRVVQRLSHQHSIGFLLHLASPVSLEHMLATRQLASSIPNVCVVRSGYIVYRTSTDMRILHSMWRWLLRVSPTSWDFFVSLSGSDYPAVDGATLSRLLLAKGNVSWRQPDRGMVAGQVNRSTAWPYAWHRFHDYGLGCEATRNYTRVSGRSFWLAKLAPDMSPSWTVPYSSGGIFHRDTIHFLVNDDRARAAYMFFRLFPTAGVEHYWATIYTLPDLAPLLTNATVVSCHMQWINDGGRLEHQGKGGTAHNTFLDMSQWSAIEREIRLCTPFLRKFDLDLDQQVLDRIDAMSASLAQACSWGEPGIRS